MKEFLLRGLISNLNLSRLHQHRAWISWVFRECLRTDSTLVHSPGPQRGHRQASPLLGSAPAIVFIEGGPPTLYKLEVPPNLDLLLGRKIGSLPQGTDSPRMSGPRPVLPSVARASPSAAGDTDGAAEPVTRLVSNLMQVSHKAWLSCSFSRRPSGDGAWHWCFCPRVPPSQCTS